MRREELEHLIRASAAILGRAGRHRDRQPGDPGLDPRGTAAAGGHDVGRGGHRAARRPRRTKSVLVDGSIGEESTFHETFGVYAHGVGERTARLPQGWRDRLVPLSNDDTNGLTGWCLEPHDLVVAKLVAGRPQHRRFCRALLQAGVVGETIASTGLRPGGDRSRA